MYDKDEEDYNVGFQFRMSKDVFKSPLVMHASQLISVTVARRLYPDEGVRLPIVTKNTCTGRAYQVGVQKTPSFFYSGEICTTS